MTRPTNTLSEMLPGLSENDVRQRVLVPILTRTPHISQVTDVHGVNERGLDIIFASEDGIRKNWYGLQLKRGNISGGGSGKRTVKTIVDQLQLARPFRHPVSTPPAGKYRMDYFLVATTGRISSTARDEIVRSLDPMPVDFWDLAEIVRRAKKFFPELLQTGDAETADYLKAIELEAETLDSLDQVAGVAKHTLSEVFVEPILRQRIDPSLAGNEGRLGGPRTLPALALQTADESAVIIGEQDGGKTAILRMIGLTQARSILETTDVNERKDPRVPIFLRAHEVLNAADLIDAAAAALEGGGARRRAETVRASRCLSAYLLLLDGFSELPEEASKKKVTEAVEVAVADLDARVILAGRPDDFLRPGFFDALGQFMIQPFDERQVGKLVRNWTKDLVEVADVAQRLVGRVRQALQLPGSPIPAIIGVMLYEKERKFITNPRLFMNHRDGG